jgi:hypothetical protein
MEKEAAPREQSRRFLAEETASRGGESSPAPNGDEPQPKTEMPAPEDQFRYTPGGCLAALLIVLMVLAATGWSRDAGSAVGLTIGGTLLAVGIGLLVDRWLMRRE